MKSLNKIWNLCFGYPFRMTLVPFSSSNHSNVTPLPLWYGVAYRNSRTSQYVCYPYPIHAIVRTALGVYKWWRFRNAVYWEHVEAEIRAFVLQEHAIYNALEQCKVRGDKKEFSRWERTLREHYKVWHGKKDKLILGKAEDGLRANSGTVVG